MKKSLRALAVLPIAAAMAMSAAAPAGAASSVVLDIDTARGNIISLGAITLEESAGVTTATVTFSYSCVGTEQALMWVSLKQPRNPDHPQTAEGLRGSDSKAWDSIHTTLPCSKGSRPVPQTATIEVEDEYGWFTDIELSAGPTFVQLCLTMPAGNNLRALGADPESPRSRADRSFGLAFQDIWTDI